MECNIVEKELKELGLSKEIFIKGIKQSQVNKAIERIILMVAYGDHESILDAFNSADNLGVSFTIQNKAIYYGENWSVGKRYRFNLGLIAAVKSVTDES